MGTPERLTPKGERTREHILDTALELFVSQGYHDTTMRDIATTAECSLGLTYRYFARKEDLVLALYRRQASEFETHAAQLEPAPMADRFVQVMQFRLTQIAPYRALFQSILGAALSPQNDLGVLGSHTDDVRDMGLSVFRMVVNNATDAPDAEMQETLAILLYTTHLCVLLFWFYDRHPHQQPTADLLALARDVLRFVRRTLRLPMVRNLLTRLARTVEPVFMPTDRTPET
jgi:AcrR family transcriptional regulator